MTKSESLNTGIVGGADRYGGRHLRVVACLPTHLFAILPGQYGIGQYRAVGFTECDGIRVGRVFANEGRLTLHIRHRGVSRSAHTTTHVVDLYTTMNDVVLSSLFSKFVFANKIDPVDNPSYLH